MKRRLLIMKKGHDANLVEPLDTNGNSSSGGKAILLSIGLSDSTQFWCCQRGNGILATN